MGFNSKGVDHVVRQMQRSTWRGIRGISIGKNADTPLDEAVRDYLVCFRAVFELADYIAVNISSPNTPDLRELQSERGLGDLLGPLIDEGARLSRENGKRTPISEYTKHGRGRQGMIAIQATERNGPLVGAVLVDDSDQVMLISTGGVLIRMAVAQIREQGRSTQGVTLINLGEGEKLAGMERIEEKDEEAGGNVNGHGEEGDGGDGEAAAPPDDEPPPTVH